MQFCNFFLNFEKYDFAIGKIYLGKLKVNPENGKIIEQPLKIFGGFRFSFYRGQSDQSALPTMTLPKLRLEIVVRGTVPSGMPWAPSDFAEIQQISPYPPWFSSFLLFLFDPVASDDVWRQPQAWMDVKGRFSASVGLNSGCCRRRGDVHHGFL